MIHFTDQLSEASFREFSDQHPLQSFFQTVAWAAVKDEWQTIYVGMYEAEKLVGASLVLKRKILPGFTMMYAPRGPLIDYENDKHVEAMFAHLQELARQHGAFRLVVDPNLKRSSGLMIECLEGKKIDTSNEKIEKIESLSSFKHLGLTENLKDTIQPRYEALVYFDEWYHQSFQRTRGYRNYKRAERFGVKAQELSIDEIELFESVMEKTEEFKNINLRDASYYRKLKAAFAEDCFIVVAYLNVYEEQAAISQRIEDFETRLSNPQLGFRKKEEYQNQLAQFKKDYEELEHLEVDEEGRLYLAGGLSIRSQQEAELLYAGMDRRFSKYNGSDMVYIKSLDWAEEKSCKSLSFGGVQGGLENGLTKYKLSFSPKMDEFIGEFQYVSKPLRNRFFNWAYKIREKIIS